MKKLKTTYKTRGEERLALRRRGEREEVDVVQETRRRVFLAVGAGRRAADDEDVPALDRTRVAVARQGGLAREAVAVAISTPDGAMRLLQAEDGTVVVAHGSPIWSRRGARVFRGPGATEDVNTVPVRDGREPVAVRRRDALRFRRDPGSRPAVLVHFQARHERVRGNAPVRPVAPEDENGVPVAGRLRRGVACEIKIYVARLIHWSISTLRPAAPPHHGVRRALVHDAPPDQRIKV